MDRKNNSKLINDSAWLNCVDGNGSKGECPKIVWHVLRTEDNPVRMALSFEVRGKKCAEKAHGREKIKLVYQNLI